MLGVEIVTLQFIKESIEYKNTKEFIINLNLLFNLEALLIAIQVLEIFLIPQWVIITHQLVIEVLIVIKAIIVKVSWAIENMIEVILYLIAKTLLYNFISKIKLCFYIIIRFKWKKSRQKVHQFLSNYNRFAVTILYSSHTIL